MVAAVDVEDLAGDEAGGVVSEEGTGGADVVDVDQLAGRSLDLGLSRAARRTRDAEGGAGGERLWRMAWTRMPFRPELGGEVRTATRARPWRRP